MMFSYSKWLFIIPARLDSQRLPRKPLQMLGNKPLIIRVVENLQPLQEKGLKIIVATDSTEVSTVCKSYNIESQITATEHQSGTDRCNEVAAQHSYKYIMNIQGDEPFVNLDDLCSLAHNFESSQSIQMATLAYKWQDDSKALDPNIVKVVKKINNTAAYFSRAAIPFVRDNNSAATNTFWQHIGVYAFHKKTLNEFCNLPPSSWEKIEKLEQLRALENNWNILVVESLKHSLGIDTHEDLLAAQQKYK